MVHADPDDLGKVSSIEHVLRVSECVYVLTVFHLQGGHELSSTTGNAGGRIACGEIKLL
jgi:Cu/Zn superoxide dismutase